jgi:hypothetical protein
MEISAGSRRSRSGKRTTGVADLIKAFAIRKLRDLPGMGGSARW